MHRKFLIAVAGILCAAPASATETGKCDAKPFTLKKPAPATPAAAPAPPVVAKTASAPTPRKAPPAAKPKYVIGCKQPVGKSG
jgi:hypothetical protein